MTPLVIVGAGGFGREALDLVRAINAATPTFEFLGFLDDGDVDAELLQRMGATCIGPTSRLAELDASYVAAIGSAEPRRRIDARARSWDRHAATLVHPSVVTGSAVSLGEGTVIAASTHLTTNVNVGRHVQVNLDCTIGHDTVVEDYVTLYPGVHVGGGVVIEQGSTLGIGSVIVPNVRIGRDAVIGAGAVVTHDVTPGATMVGPSARATLNARGAGR